MMTGKTIRCPRCDTVLAAGFILDRGHYDVGAVSRWVEGEPERSIWTGIKTKDRENFKVTTYRCADCGYLESYAFEQEQEAEK